MGQFGDTYEEIGPGEEDVPDAPPDISEPPKDSHKPSLKPKKLSDTAPEKFPEAGREVTLPLLGPPLRDDAIDLRTTESVEHMKSIPPKKISLPMKSSEQVASQLGSKDNHSREKRTDKEEKSLSGEMRSGKNNKSANRVRWIIILTICTILTAVSTMFLVICVAHKWMGANWIPILRE